MGTNTQQLSNLQLEKLSNQIVEWQSVFTGDGSTGLTAVAGRGYFIDTTSGTVTVTLPASPSQGDTIQISDYAGTFATNNVTINPNGGKIQNSTENGTLADNNASVSFVYMDSTKGWKQTSLDTSSAVNTPLYISASGGTVLTTGDYKTHVYTGDGCFVVSCAGNAVGSNSVEYLVVAGGGGSGTGCAGGAGGAGGFRTYTAIACSSPLNACSAIPVSVTSYPITVGGGGVGGPTSGPGASSNPGTQGSSSIFSTITSAGGGAGGGGHPGSPAPAGGAGGSGGGGGHNGGLLGAGNTPPVSPPQGNPGATSNPAGLDDQGASGGGASTAGVPTTGPGVAGNGGAGSFIPSPFIGPTAPSYGETGPEGRYFAGGGGASVRTSPANPIKGVGGLGGGADGITGPTNGNAGSTNMGGGASGGASNAGAVSGAGGGSGIVMIRYKYQ